MDGAEGGCNGGVLKVEGKLRVHRWLAVLPGRSDPQRLSAIIIQTPLITIGTVSVSQTVIFVLL